MSVELNHLEREVEQARQRLTQDLGRLRSPATFSSFKDDLWAEARQSKDDLVEKTKEAARDGAQHFFTEIKERAAANPAAALAIGAGLAWRLAHKPPIASLLVGVGVVSLMRTNPQNGSVGAEMVARAGELAASAKEKAERWSANAGSAVQQGSQVVGSAKERLEEWATEAGDAAQEAARSVADRASKTIYAAVQEGEERDSFLLGAAAIAIATAIGIASHRRLS